MTDDFPDIDEDTVTVDEVGDYEVHLNIDGLPDGSVAVDYYKDEVRLLVRGDDLEAGYNQDPSGDDMYLITFKEQDDN